MVGIFGTKEEYLDCVRSNIKHNPLLVGDTLVMLASCWIEMVAAQKKHNESTQRGCLCDLISSFGYRRKIYSRSETILLLRSLSGLFVDPEDYAGSVAETNVLKNLTASCIKHKITSVCENNNTQYLSTEHSANVFLKKLIDNYSDGENENNN